MCEPWLIDRLADDLQRLGLGTGNLVMVHASLRAVGPVDGGAGGLLDAIESVIGPTGTMLMMVSARDDASWVNEQPEHERATLLAGTEPFDARRAPSDPDNGALAEVFRCRPGAVPSDHPEGRFVASGRLAAALTTDVPWDDYYGPGSPLERLVDHGGLVLRLGADLDTVTLLHLAEYLVGLPDKRRVRRHRLVATPDGTQVRVVECLDDSDGIVDHPGEDYFAVILRAYLATGRARVGTVGSATSELLAARDLVPFGVAWMVANLGR